MARLFVDNLSVIDFAYLDRARGIVGESWIVDIELAGQLDDQGMVFDFGNIKKQVKQLIDDEIDHRLLVPTASPGTIVRPGNKELYIGFPLLAGGLISHQSPKNAVLTVDTDVIERKSTANYLQTKIKSILPDNVSEVRINLRHEPIHGAYYQYTHGLQTHMGQCQRIAHGHRSRIEIRVNGERDQQLEAQWADRLKDSYIATESHVINEFELNDIPHKQLAYTAQQGYFAISLPSAQVFIMPTKSTVENIADHLADMIARQNKANILVKAFEGLGKGAFSEAVWSTT